MNTHAKYCSYCPSTQVYDYIIWVWKYGGSFEMKKRDIPLRWSFFVNEKRVNLKHSSSPFPFHSFHTMIKYYNIPFSITWKSHPIYILSFIKFTTPPVCPLYNILTLWIPFQNFQTGDRNKTRGMELKSPSGIPIKRAMRKYTY